MRRRRQAVILLAALALTLVPSLASLAPSGGVAAHCRQVPICCGKAGCAMHAGSAACACAVSESTLAPVSHADFHFNLPCAAQMLPTAVSARRSAAVARVELSGFASPPDQPPRNLL